MPPEQNPTTRQCSCGAEVPLDEFDFWGECFECRTGLPIGTSQTGDDKRSSTDQNYHGGQFQNGEW